MTLCLLSYFELSEGAIVLEKKGRLSGHYLGVIPTRELSYLVLPIRFAVIGPWNSQSVSEDDPSQYWIGAINKFCSTQKPLMAKKRENTDCNATLSLHVCKKSAVSHSKLKTSRLYIINSQFLPLCLKQMHHFFFVPLSFLFLVLTWGLQYSSSQLNIQADKASKLVTLTDALKDKNWVSMICRNCGKEKMQTLGIECRHQEFQFPLLGTQCIVGQKVRTQSWMAVISSFLYVNIGIIWY